MGRHPEWYVSILGRTDGTLAEAEDSLRQRSIMKGTAPQRKLHTRGEAERVGAQDHSSEGAACRGGITGSVLGCQRYRHWGSPPSSHPSLLPGHPVKESGSRVCRLSQEHRGESESHVWVLGVSPCLVGRTTVGNHLLLKLNIITFIVLCL